METSIYRWLLLLYGLCSYAVFVATMAYAMAFFANLFVGRTIDAAPTVPLEQALLVNSALLVGFAVQHSGMARAAFRNWMGRYVPSAARRSTYVLVSSATMIVLMLLWQPLGWVVWSVEVWPANEAVLLAYFFGWALMIRATFLVDHWQRFGLRQVWCAFRGPAPCRTPAFHPAGAYRYVRHPTCTGWLIVLWAAPVMTTSRLLIAVGLTLYIVIGASLAERDLERRLPYYAQYRRKVPMLLPSWRRHLAAETPDVESGRAASRRNG